MKKFISNNYTLITLGILFVFVLWTIISYSDGNGNFLFPNPIETFKSLGDLLGRVYTYQSIGWTLLRTIIGFTIAFIFALIIGVLAGIFKKMQVFLKPLMIVLKCVPTAAFVYLFLVRSGSRFAPVYIVFLVSFPILYESVIGGMNNIPQEIEDTLKLDSHSLLDPILKVKLPLSFPYIAIGLASSFALSIKTEIMAEIITGDTNYGLGCMISGFRQSDPTNLAPLFAIAVIAVIIVLIISLFSRLIENKMNEKIGN